MDAAKQCNLPEPEFIEMSEMFRINLYRKPFFSDALPKDGTETGDTGIETKKTGTETRGTGTETQGTGTEMQDSGTETQDTDIEIHDTGTETKETDIEIENIDTETKVLTLIGKRPTITITEMAETLNLSKNGVVYVLEKLRKKGILVREGAQKKSSWIIKKRD